MDGLKPLQFRGRSLQDLRDFPVSARKAAGYQLEQVQWGLDPADWKPMPGVGPGVREIRVRTDDGAFRVVYVAVFAEAIYVLHCFAKKTQQTTKADVDLAAARYAALKQERGK